jgi:hypothetical protein
MKLSVVSTNFISCSLSLASCGLFPGVVSQLEVDPRRSDAGGVPMTRAIHL